MYVLYCIALTVVCISHLLPHHDWLIYYNLCTLLVKLLQSLPSASIKKLINWKTKSKPGYFMQLRNHSQDMSGKKRININNEHLLLLYYTNWNLLCMLKEHKRSLRPIPCQLFHVMTCLLKIEVIEILTIKAGFDRLTSQKLEALKVT